ncbi:GNAT family N-acetyltransferase [Pedobacter sp. SYSU D00535]|uniref:GNAT family N-acetyltransferase n=1 Tax=Pedobacter sp. SYSU D00535 TaxID=2810308 RepID=UPI001A96549C|nr:GNAT family N-acetyltransferase [Pedobacter sp. SYSU D00535]
MNDHIVLETERLYLREITFDDAEAMFEMDADPEVQTFLGKPIAELQQSLDMIAFIRSQYEENGVGRWAIVDKVEGRFVGWTGLKLIKDTVNGYSGYYDIGYRLLRKFWGRGYAFEATKAAVEYGFNVMNLKTMFAIADANNHASIAILKKLGFSAENLFLYNERDHYWFSIKRKQP